ncbi:unnamed protein product [Phytophthora fragariaefolia]|uniref:Unnamed protein product n=1 Tax=Phytophthora fragariaefolia TaxID=1490495 RepID=A0A9W6X5E8_9STRA|nr:unnamed protein product [Phytophthora fragariaefolia]
MIPPVIGPRQDRPQHTDAGVKDIDAAVTPDPLISAFVTTDVLVIIRRVQPAQPSGTQGEQKGLAMDLEEKPRPPTQAPSGTPADRDPPDEDPTVKTEGPSSNQTPPASHSASKKKKSKTARRKLKAPGSEAGDHEEPQTWTDNRLESAFHYKCLHRLMDEDPVMKIMRLKPIGELQGRVKGPREASDMLDAVKILMGMLKDAGVVLGSFDANELFDMEQSAIRETTLNLFARLAPIVCSVVPVPQEASTPTRGQAGSSHYASTSSEAGSG